MSRPCDVLLIQSDSSASGAVSGLLEDWEGSTGPHRVLRMETVSDALEILEDRHFDVVLLDPAVAGERVLADLDAVRARTAGAPIILLWGEGVDRRVAERANARAADHVERRDLSAEVLHRTLRNALEKASYRRKAEQLEVFKTNLVATASHELRTPLAIIREYVALVHDEVPGPLNDKQRECLTGALRNCDRLATLIHNTLDLHRLERHSTELRRSRLDLDPLLRGCARDFELQASKKGLSLEVDLAPDLPSVLGDTQQLVQVVVNLLGNALKFTPSGGTVRLTAHASGEASVAVSVEDDGIGIPEEDQERIFEPFAQVDRLDAPGAQGTGLGLAIVARIAEAHHGTVGVQSAVGGGSVFTLTVPTYTERGEVDALINDHAASASAAGKRLGIVAVRIARQDLDMEPLLKEIHGLLTNAVRRRDDSVLAAPDLGLVLAVGVTERPGSDGFVERLESAILEQFGDGVPVEFAYTEIGEEEDPSRVLEGMEYRSARRSPIRVLVLPERSAIQRIRATIEEHLGTEITIQVAQDVLDCMASLGRAMHDVVIVERSAVGDVVYDVAARIQALRPHTRVIVLADQLPPQIVTPGVSTVSPTELAQTLLALHPRADASWAGATSQMH